ncbi:MAG: 5-(carboxyamino)imidazole ribonucleotide synthase [Gammaproteobacteria bacterium]
MILPGATLGVLGGGQLGRMFTLAARNLGYRVLVLDPDPDSPAGSVADVHLQADYDDPQALARLGAECAAVTTEWENVPASTLELLAAHCPVRPGAESVAVARDRIREKTFVRDLGLATAPFFAILAEDDLAAAVAGLRLPALLKSATLGYDGKGQYSVDSLEQARAGFAQLGGRPCVLEEKVDLAQELSVVLARGGNGETEFYPVGENVHRNGILHTTRVPGRVSAAVAEHALGMARRVAEALDYVGVLAVEFFFTRDGELLINEMAPRPHNSGHYTLDACATSQFEQQVRALCGLPLGSTRLLSPVTMLNLLGDLWGDAQPDWAQVFRHPEARLHLYGKREARAGRKMGHINVLSENADASLELAEQLFATLSRGS